MKARQPFISHLYSNLRKFPWRRTLEVQKSRAIKEKVLFCQPLQFASLFLSRTISWLTFWTTKEKIYLLRDYYRDRRSEKHLGRGRRLCSNALSQSFVRRKKGRGFESAFVFPWTLSCRVIPTALFRVFFTNTSEPSDCCGRQPTKPWAKGEGKERERERDASSLDRDFRGSEEPVFPCCHLISFPLSLFFVSSLFFGDVHFL